MKKFLLLFSFVFLLATPVSASSCWKIMTFGSGNTTEWEQSVRLDTVRANCSGDPSACLENILNPTTGYLIKYKKIFLGIIRDPSLTADYALQYSNLSLSYPKIYEIDIDDFYTFWKDIIKLDNEELKKIIDNAKKINSKLKFGITVYDDNLPLLNSITAANRGKINYVHLYPHHRQTNIEADVATAKSLFPNAKIIAGSYALDFKSPCTNAVDDNVACSGSTELNYYKDSLERQVVLMKKCQVEAIEFFPALFGHEEKMDRYHYACLNKGFTIDECIANTKKIRAAAQIILNNYIPSLTPTLTPTPTKITTPTPTPTKILTPTPTKIPTLTPTPTKTISKCTQCSSLPLAKGRADADCSGITALNDYSIWRSEFISGGFGTTSKTDWVADFDCDSKVTLNDVSIWRDNFVKSL